MALYYIEAICRFLPDLIKQSGRMRGKLLFPFLKLNFRRHKDSLPNRIGLSAFIFSLFDLVRAWSSDITAYHNVNKEITSISPASFQVMRGLVSFIIFQIEFTTTELLKPKLHCSCISITLAQNIIDVSKYLGCTKFTLKQEINFAKILFLTS